MDANVLNLAIPAAGVGSPADERPAAVDRRQLRVPRRRLADDDGGARGPCRPPPDAADRRCRLRAGFAAGGVLHQPGDADRGAGAARRRGSHADAVDPGPDPRRCSSMPGSAPRPSGSGPRASRSVACSPRSSRGILLRRTGGAPSSWSPTLMLLLVALGRVLLPEFRDAGAARWTCASAGLSLARCSSVVYGIKRAAESGVGPVAAWRSRRALPRRRVRRAAARRPTRSGSSCSGTGGFSRPLATNAMSSSCSTACSSSSRSTSSSCSGCHRWAPACGRSRRRSATWSARRSARVAASESGPLLDERAAWRSRGRVRAARAGRAGGRSRPGRGVGRPVRRARAGLRGRHRGGGRVRSRASGAASGMLETTANLGGALGIAVLGSLGGASSATP